MRIDKDFAAQKVQIKVILRSNPMMVKGFTIHEKNYHVTGKKMEEIMSKSSSKKAADQTYPHIKMPGK